MIEKVVIKNFRTFRNSTIQLNPGLNILVGNNEAGKSTFLEAIHLVLTARLGRNHVLADLSPYLINREAVKMYLDELGQGQPATPPAILIELYLSKTPDTVSLCGMNNSLREDCPGIRLKICFDDDYRSEYEEFLQETDSIKSVPIEYYKAEWVAFSGATITRRGLRLRAFLIDASRIKLKSGSDYFLQRIIEESLTDKERVNLARTYRSLRETFADTEQIVAINASLDKRQKEITEKTLSMSIDVSTQTAWESNLVPHLDDLPLHHSGGGEQSTLKILLALTRQVDSAHVVLIEEPENHLAYPQLSKLIKKIEEICSGRQVIITTHSAYVLNKLGLQNLLLLKHKNTARLLDLPEDTQRYFKKLPGYDTLRMVLANTVILVEGASDELVVQRAFLDQHGCLPVQNGVDVISAGGLSFKRFLDISLRLGTKTTVVTDNDGDPAAVATRYSDYTASENIYICYSDDAGLPSLEPQIVACNDLPSLNSVIGSEFDSKEALLEYIKKSRNKTEAAVRIFDTDLRLVMPDYIRRAVDV